MKALVITLVILLPALAACGGSDSGGEQATVSFMAFGEPEEIKAFRDVIAAYEEEEPDTTVQLIEASDRDDLLARLGTAFSGGTPPDLFLINYRYYGQFAARDVLEPIASRLEGSDAFEEDDFYEPALDAFRWDGDLTCLPQNISSLVVYYNRHAFARYGVPEPRAGWSWDDMVGKAAKLTKNTDGKGRFELYGLGVEPSIIRVAPFIWSNGGEIVDDEAQPTRMTFDTPAGVEALARFFELRQVHGVIPTEQEVEAEDDETRFMNGRLAMLLSSRRVTPTFRTIEDFDWDVAPLPKLEQEAGILHSDAYCMTRASEQKDAAWGFMEYALGPEGQRVVARSGRTVPSLEEVAESDAFLDPNAKPRNSQAFLDGIPAIRRVPTVSTWPEIEDAVEPLLEQGLYRGAPAGQVASQADKVSAPLFARAQQ